MENQLLVEASSRIVPMVAKLMITMGRWNNESLIMPDGTILHYGYCPRQRQQSIVNTTINGSHVSLDLCRSEDMNDWTVIVFKMDNVTHELSIVPGTELTYTHFSKNPDQEFPTKHFITWLSKAAKATIC